MMFCPRCKSTDLGLDPDAGRLGEAMSFDARLCHACGYRGTFFPSK